MFLGYLGVIVDVDFEYLFVELEEDEIVVNDELCVVFWYYVVMEDDDGQLIYIYLVEVQLSSEICDEYLEQLFFDELVKMICQQLQVLCFCN